MNIIKKEKTKEHADKKKNEKKSRKKSKNKYEEDDDSDYIEYSNVETTKVKPRKKKK